MTRLWTAWVALWDRRESPMALVLVRLFVGLALLVDLLHLASLGMVQAMFTAAPAGYALAVGGFGAEILEAGFGPALWLFAVIAAACVLCGLFTRVACISLSLALAQLAMIAPDADRGIHMALRIVLVILALSGCHARWSIDAWLRSKLGRPRLDSVPAWPRYLLLLQLLWIYVSAAMNKSGAEWGPGGGFMALANALADPHFGRFDPAWVTAVLPLTQLATLATIAFEWTAPLYLVLLYCAQTADRPGRLRAWINRLRLRWIWIGTGVAFHLGLVIALPIGMFPWGMLALYPVLLRPSELRRRSLAQ